MCTSVNFIDNNNNLYFGRNLDWSCSYGEKVVITPTGYQPHSPFGAIKEIKYPVIGMGIIQEDTPLYFDCANSEGLAVAGLNFPGYAYYYEAPAQRYAPVIYLAAYEFPLWVASQFTSVKELKEKLNYVLIVDKPINDKYPSSLLHWIVADSEDCIVIEQDKTALYIHENPFRVLANQPGFNWHKENIKNYLNCSPEVPNPIGEENAWGSGAGMRGIPGDYSTTSRFVRATYLTQNYPIKDTEQENVTKLFKILGGVSMIEGAAKMLDGNYEITVFTSGYSSRTNTYYYQDYNNSTIQEFKLDNYLTNYNSLLELDVK